MNSPSIICLRLYVCRHGLRLEKPLAKAFLDNVCDVDHSHVVVVQVIGCGSITDGTYKLEVHILNFTNEDYFAQDINKGDHVEVIGIMETTGNKSL